MNTKPSNWRDDLTEQELELLNTAQVYAANNLKGVPGHHMMMLCATLIAKLDGRPRFDITITNDTPLSDLAKRLLDTEGADDKTDEE